MSLLHSFLSFLFTLQGSIQQLLSILFAHRRFLLFLLLLLLLLLFFLLFFLLLLLLLLLILILFLLFVVVIATVLIVVLQLALAEHQIITRLIVIGVIPQRILVSLDGLSEFLDTLICHTFVMKSLRLAQWIRLILCSLFKHLGHGVATLLLRVMEVTREHGRTQVIYHPSIRTVGTIGFQIVYLSLLPFVAAVLCVTLPDKLTCLSVVCMNGCRQQYQYQ